jgi:hypothetical protein
MSLKPLVNNHWMSEDKMTFPNPELVISTVRHFDDIKFLGKDRSSELEGLVYFYANQDWKTNPIVYVGETKVDAYSRYTATHVKAIWKKKITLPLIGIAYNPKESWDTDTRRFIEASVAYNLKLVWNLTVSNTENKTWNEQPNLLDIHNKHYIKRVSELIVTRIAYELGLEYTPTEITNLAKNKLPNIIEESPPLIGPVIFRSGKIIAYGEFEPNGLVIVTKIENMKPTVAKYGALLTKQLHSDLLSQSVQNEDGSYNWSGRTEPSKPTTYLSVAVGGTSSNDWKLLDL